MSLFTRSCFLLLLLPQSEVSDVRPCPLLRRASVLHPAENAAGCHGSSAGNGEGGARLQLRLPPDQHQHPGGELRPHRARLHHHLCGPVLPRGNRAAATRSDFLRLLRCAFTLLSPPPTPLLWFSVLATGFCLHGLRRSARADGLQRGVDLQGEAHRGVSAGGQLPHGNQLQVRQV